MSKQLQVNRRTDGVRHDSLRGQTGQGQTNIILPELPSFPGRLKSEFPELVQMESEWLSWRNAVQAQFPVPVREEVFDVEGSITSHGDLIGDLVSRVNSLDSSVAVIVKDIVRLGSDHGIDVSKINVLINDLQSQINALKSKIFVLHHQSQPETTWTVVHKFGYLPNVMLMNDDYSQFMSSVDNGSHQTIATHKSSKTGWMLLR